MRSAEMHRGNCEASGEESYGRFLDNRMRTYDPGTGRYVSADPIGQLGGDTNVYAYAFNAPLFWFDPLGLASLTTTINPDGTSTTTFDPRPEDPNSSAFSINTRNNVTRDSRPGAAGDFSTDDVSVVPRTNNPRAYGPDGTYIDTGDPRGRDLHGGGSCPAVTDSQAPQQGWCPTRGCTRGQNADVKALADRIKDFQSRHPNVAIPYTRTTTGGSQSTTGVHQ
jgi:RHS repeat-associated protein